jgi:RNase adapter protein RapZ
MKPSRLVILSGMSGSGKSAAVRCFEDMGYFCVDNLPIKLIPLFIELIGRSAEVRARIALVIDIREGGFLQDFPDILDELKGAVQEIQVLFFEARDPVLVRRFSETRRPHPLAIAGSVEEGIAKEREALRPLRDRADRIIDTSHFNVHELKTYLYDHFSESGGVRTLFVSVVSFGYKHGLPADADLVFDVRFFPNPFFVDRLRAKTGLDREVTEYLEGISEYVAFCARIEDLLAFLLPYYVREGKAYLTIAFGCTGGRHRSVAIAERIGRALLGPAYRTRVSHRDVVKE